MTPEVLVAAATEIAEAGMHRSGAVCPGRSADDRIAVNGPV
jgi:hypothetical protein